MIEMPVLRLLTRESLRDASRRRIVPAVIILCFLTLASINSCTTCNAEISTNVQADTSQLDVLAWLGLTVMGVLAAWSVVLAGLLASDHLSSSLEDGSGLLILARPVSRRDFVLARLTGVLAIALTTVVVTLGGASAMLSARGDLVVWPALLAIGATMANCVSLAALAMLSSLFLPRIVTFLCVLAGVAWTSIANLLSASGAELGFVGGLLDAFGPPILSGVIVPLAVWSGQSISGPSSFEVIARLVIWAFGSVAVLVFVFGRQELTRFELR